MRETFFSNNYAENETERLVPELTLCFKKPSCKVGGQHLSFNICWEPPLVQTIKSNSIRFQYVDPEISSNLTFYVIFY